MVLVGRHLLPDRQSLSARLPKPSDRHFFAEVLVPIGSPLIGSPLKAAGFSESRGLWVMDVLRGDRSLRSSLDTVELVAGDRIVVRSKMGDMLGLREAGGVAPGRPGLAAFGPTAPQGPVPREKR